MQIAQKNLKGEFTLNSTLNSQHHQRDEFIDFGLLNLKKARNVIRFDRQSRVNYTFYRV